MVTLKMFSLNAISRGDQCANAGYSQVTTSCRVRTPMALRPCVRSDVGVMLKTFCSENNSPPFYWPFVLGSLLLVL